MNAAAPTPRPPAGERGATRIADRVVAKIASQAALEALQDAPHAALVPPDRRRPQVTAVVHPARTRIEVAVDLGYPVDIVAVCARVRRHVTDRVGALAGLSVPESSVGIEVERLHSAATRDARQADQRRVT